MAQDDRISGLAKQIEAAKKRAHLARSAEEIEEIRRRGACELHAICSGFVSSINSRLSGTAVNLSPPEYAAEMFRGAGTNLFQIGSEGREVHVAFQATREPVSTEKFLIPYVLEGEVRSFNQKMLERFEIRSLLLFYCLENDKASWRFFDWRTRHTGLFGHDLLLSLMERLF